LRFIHELQNFTHDDGALEVETVNVFLFKTYRHQSLVNVFRGDIVGQIDVLAQPGQGNSH
jgi:hypothetical protein